MRKARKDENLEALKKRRAKNEKFNKNYIKPTEVRKNKEKGKEE